jgi:hypothetical protein
MSSREENLAVVVVSCAALIMVSLNNQKRKTRRWWRTELYKSGLGRNWCWTWSPSTFVGSTKILRVCRLLISRIHWAEYVYQVQRLLFRPLRNSQDVCKQQYKQDPATTPSQLELSIPLCSSKKRLSVDTYERFKSGFFGTRDPVLTTQIWFTSGYITGLARKCIRIFRHTFGRYLDQRQIHVR